MKIEYFFLLIYLFMFPGCSEFDLTDAESNHQYIESDSDLEQAVTGAYAKFAEIFYSNRGWRNSFMFISNFADDLNIHFVYSPISGCSGDDCLYNAYTRKTGFQTTDINGDTVYLRQGCEKTDFLSDDYYINFFNEDITSIYRNAYKAIVSQNNIINKFTDLSVLDTTQKRLLGEVYYLRAYTYFFLTRVFGNIVLVTDTDVDYNLTYASFGEIYQQIETDLKKAVLLIPRYNSNTIPSTICPNNSTVKALLAEVYLTMGGFPLHDQSKYALAAQYAREVIESASINGFRLKEDFARLYTWEFVHNEEMVSGIQYKSEYQKETVENGGAVYNPVFNSNELAKYTIPVFGEMKFMNNCPYNYRKQETFDMKHSDSYFAATTLVDDTVFYPLQTTTCYYCPVKKTSSVYYDKYFDNTESYPVYLLRFAHTLLTYAEASARAGNIDDLSYEAVNMVRRRANKLSVNTPSVYDLTQGVSTEEFIDSVVWERAWEFVGEIEGRWFDLLRLEMCDDLNELRSPLEAPMHNEYFRDGTYFLRIPGNDWYLNPNLTMN